MAYTNLQVMINKLIIRGKNVLVFEAYKVGDNDMSIRLAKPITNK